MNPWSQRLRRLLGLALLTGSVALSISGCDRRSPTPTTGAETNSTAPAPQSSVPGASEAMPAEPPASR